MSDYISPRRVGKFLKSLDSSRKEILILSFEDAAKLAKEGSTLFEVLEDGQYYVPYTDCDHYCESIKRPSEDYIENVQQMMLNNLSNLINNQFDHDRDTGKFKMATRHGILVEKKVYKLSWRFYLCGFIITMAEMKKVIVRKGLDKAGVGSLDSSPYGKNQLLGCVGFYKSKTDHRILEPYSDSPLADFMVQNITGDEIILKYDSEDDDRNEVDESDVDGHYEGARFAPSWEILVQLVMSLDVTKRCERGSYQKWVEVGWAIAGVARVAKKFEDGLELWLQFCRQCEKSFNEDPMKAYVIYRRSRSQGRQRGWKSLMEWLKEDNSMAYEDIRNVLGTSTSQTIDDKHLLNVVRQFLSNEFRCRPKSITSLVVTSFESGKFLVVDTTDTYCPIIKDEHLEKMTTGYYTLGLRDAKEKCRHESCKGKCGVQVESAKYPPDLGKSLKQLLSVDKEPEEALQNLVRSSMMEDEFGKMNLSIGEKKCSKLQGDRYDLPENRYCPIHQCFHEHPENCLRLSQNYQRIGLLCRRDPFGEFPPDGLTVPQNVVNIFIQNANFGDSGQTSDNSGLLMDDYKDDELPFFQNDKQLQKFFVKSFAGNNHDLSEFAHALWGEEFRFFYGQWHRFESHIWEQLDGSPILRHRLSTLLCDELEAAQLYYRNNKTSNRAKDKETMIQRTVANLKAAHFKDSVMKEVKEKFQIENKGFEKLVNQADLLPFKNGVLDVNSYEFRPGQPDDKMTKSAKIEYREFDDNNELCHELENFFITIMPDERVREFLLKVSALCMTRETKYQLFVVLTGIGANGKSIYLDLMSEMLGDFAVTSPIELLTGKREASYATNPSMVELDGARLASFNEPSSTGVIHAETMKVLTGGRDKISARGNYEKQRTFVPTFKMLLACNVIPRMSEDTEAVWRRVQVVHFPMKFCDDPDPENPFEALIDVDLSGKIPLWAPFLPNYLLRYLRMLREDGLRKPAEVDRGIEYAKTGGITRKLFWWTEHKVREYARTLTEVLPGESSPSWLFSRRFDIHCTSLDLFIEVDGEQHFKSVSRFPGCFQERQKVDVWKMRQALRHGFSVVRLAQEDAVSDKIDWRLQLRTIISLVQTRRSKPAIWYLAKSADLYSAHKMLMRCRKTIVQEYEENW